MTTTRDDRALLWTLTLAGLALRLYDLAGESLWLDEIVTGFRVHERLNDILFGWDSRSQGPLYYLWVKAWGLLVGVDEWRLRIWSAVWGTLTIPAVYALGREIGSRTAARWSAAFVAVLPFAVHYSQEARPYALFLLLSALSYLYALRLLRGYSMRNAVWYVLWTTAAFYTHPFALFLVGSQVVLGLLLWRDGEFDAVRQQPKKYVIVFGILGVLCLHEFWQNFVEFSKKVEGVSTAGWIPVPGWLWLIKAPASLFMQLELGGAMLGFAFAILIWRRSQVSRATVLFLASVAVFFWLVPFALSHIVTPIAVERYSAPGALSVVLLMGAAVSYLCGRVQRVVAVLLLAATAYPLYGYYTGVDKDPWRQCASYLEERIQPDDVVIVFPKLARGKLDWYASDSLKQELVEPENTTVFAPILWKAKRLWVVETYPPGKHDLDLLKLAYRWGKVSQAVNLDDILPMHRYRYWSVPIRVTLREAPPKDLPKPTESQ